MKETGVLSSRPQGTSPPGDPAPRNFWRRQAKSAGGWRLVLSASEIGGGVVGAVVFITQALGSARPVWHTASALVFCALSALAGWRLLRRLPGGLGLSIAMQAAQVLWVWLPGAAYRITSGIALVVNYTTGRGPDAIVGATAAFRLGLPDPGAGVGAGINLFAVVALIALVRLRRARVGAPGGPGATAAALTVP